MLALGALLLAACGGDDSGTAVNADTDPQEVLDAALGGGGDPIKSGVLDLEFNLDSKSSDLGSISASLKGPFSSNGDGDLPDVDFDVTAGADVGGPTLSFQGGIVLTEDGLWINYDDQAYQLDDQAFAQVKDSYAKSSQLQDDEEDSSSFSQFGVDPQTWLTDVSNEGQVDIDGTETVHVTGKGDIAKIVSDLDSVAQKSGQGTQLDPAQLKQLKDSVGNSVVDVYANTDDGTLRELDVTLDVANGGGNGDSTVKLSIGIADRTPPGDRRAADAQPLSDLLGRFPGAADSLGGLAPSSGTGTGTGTGGGGDSSAYYQCVSRRRRPRPSASAREYLK